MKLLTPNDVRDCELSVHKFCEGYDVDEVDDLLDSVAFTHEVLASMVVKLQKQVDKLENVCRMHGINIH